MLHLAKQNNEVGLASLLSLASGSVGKELLPALEIHLPTLLSSKNTLLNMRSSIGRPGNIYKTSTR